MKVSIIFRTGNPNGVTFENVSWIEKRRRFVVRKDKKLCYLAYVLWFNYGKDRIDFPAGWVTIIRTAR